MLFLFCCFRVGVLGVVEGGRVGVAMYAGRGGFLISYMGGEVRGWLLDRGLGFGWLVIMVVVVVVVVGRLGRRWCEEIEEV